MNTLRLIKGKGHQAPDRQYAQLFVALCISWESAIYQQDIVKAILADLSPKNRHYKRIALYKTLLEAHSSRILGRMASLESKLLPVPAIPNLAKTAQKNIEVLERLSRSLCNSLTDYAQLARDAADPASAWVFELNAAENGDIASELVIVLQKL